MRKKGCSHEGNLLTSQIISVIFTIDQYFTDGNARFGLPCRLSGEMAAEGGSREDIMADAINIDKLKSKAEEVIDTDELKAKAEKFVDTDKLKDKAEKFVDTDELKAKAESVLNTDELKAKADKYARRAQETVDSISKELNSKSRCQCVGQTLLWGGVIVAALAGLCAIGRWLKK